MARWDRSDFDDYCSRNREDPKDILHEKAWKGLVAYEELLHQRNGKRQRATYTWRGLKDKGLIKSMEDRILSSKKQPAGFMALVEGGKAKLTDEYQLLQFAIEILKFRNDDPRTKQAMGVAKARLREFGCAIP